jgi:hypothetical protein
VLDRWPLARAAIHCDRGLRDACIRTPAARAVGCVCERAWPWTLARCVSDPAAEGMSATQGGSPRRLRRRSWLVGAVYVDVAAVIVATVAIVTPVSSSAHGRSDSSTPAATTSSSGTSGGATPEAPVAVDGPPASLGPWTSVFDDEFDGDAIDRTKWRVNRYGGTDDDGAFNPEIEAAYYSPDNVSEENGAGVLEVRAEPALVEGKEYSYSSGVITTQGIFLAEDGDYVEARIWVPAGDGLWPAFWTVPDGHWPPEIDMAEFPDTSTRTRPEFVYHTPDGVTAVQTTYGSEGVDYRNSWHTYGLLRTDGRLVPYLDGVPYPGAALAAGADAEPQFIVLNLAVYADHTPITGTQLLVDWVRVWRPT